MKTKIQPCLWYDGDVEEAANFYTKHIPDSHIDRITRSPLDNPYNPGNKTGDVLTVEFTLAGVSFIGLNGGPHFKFNEAVSMTLDCEDQEEVDHYWEVLREGGGEVIECGWLRDRWGLCWQIIPRRLPELMAHRDVNVARRTMEAMLEMKKIQISILERAAFPNS